MKIERKRKKVREMRLSGKFKEKSFAMDFSKLQQNELNILKNKNCYYFEESVPVLILFSRRNRLPSAS